MKKYFNGFTSVMLLCLMVSLMVTPADAAVRLTLSSPGTPTLVINDNDAGEDALPGLDGAILFAGSYGSWTLNVVTGTTLGSPNPLIDLNSSNTGIGPALTLTFSSTDNVGPVPSFVSTIGGTLANGHSITYQAWVGANVLDTMDTAIGPLQSFGPPPPFGFSGEVSGGTAGAGLYGLTQQVVLSATSTGTSSFDAAVFPVPEPASVALFGGVLLFTSVALRRKAKLNKAE